MPQDRATAEELLSGVEAFLRKDVLPQLSGNSIYKCRVAANILSIVQRELAQGEKADAAELSGLKKLLDRESDAADTSSALDELNGQLCKQIRLGQLDKQRESVFAHVRSTLTKKVEIANPRYAGLKK